MSWDAFPPPGAISTAPPSPSTSGGRPSWKLQRGALLQNLGRLSDAAAVYRRVLRQPMAPMAVRAIMANNLALIDAQHGRLGAAMAHLDHAADSPARSARRWWRWSRRVVAG